MADHYVEPCAECAIGRHTRCEGRARDHAVDEMVPCPCRAGNHTSLQMTLPFSA